MVSTMTEEQYREYRKRRNESARKYVLNNLVKVKKRNSRWQKNNPDKVKIFSKRRDIKLKYLVLSFYCKGEPHCICCGEKTLEFLSIDHINGGGRRHRDELKKMIGYKGNSALYRWLRDTKFPEGFQVLCMNCNWVKGYFKYCPHKDLEKHNGYMNLLRGEPKVS